MSFIQRELDRIAVALREPRSAEEYVQLYAAQQALSWGLDPAMFKSPYNLITGIEVNSEDCLFESDRVSS
jgi:hypothetical protein